MIQTAKNFLSLFFATTDSLMSKNQMWVQYLLGGYFGSFLYSLLDNTFWGYVIFLGAINAIVVTYRLVMVDDYYRNAEDTFGGVAILFLGGFLYIFGA